MTDGRASRIGRFGGLRRISHYENDQWHQRARFHSHPSDPRRQDLPTQGCRPDANVLSCQPTAAKFPMISGRYPTPCTWTPMLKSYSTTKPVENTTPISPFSDRLGA